MRKYIHGIFILALLAVAGVSASPALAVERFITLASTTSTEASGLFGHILPVFLHDKGIEVRVVAVGTGQALKLGERGDADALLVHDRIGEDKFVAAGHGIDRRDVMYNDFVIIGPQSDPAKIKGLKDAPAALRLVAASKAPFASRGDDSGTHRMELRLWRQAGVDVKSGGEWYRELGAGMGAALNTAAGLNAYILSDRATWAAFKNRQQLAVLVEDGAELRNPYGSILVNPAKHPTIKADEARIWHEWLTSPSGQQAIASYRIGGQQLFFPNASGAAANIAR